MGIEICRTRPGTVWRLRLPSANRLGRSSGCGRTAHTAPEAPNTGRGSSGVISRFTQAEPLSARCYRNEPTYAPWPASENRLKVLFTHLMSRGTRRAPARWRLPMSVQRSVLSVMSAAHRTRDPGDPLIRAGVEADRPDRMWLVPLTLLVGAYPKLLVLWDVDGLEARQARARRHGRNPDSDDHRARPRSHRARPAWLAGARVQGRVYPAPSPFRLEADPAGRRPTRYEAVIACCSSWASLVVSPFGSHRSGCRTPTKQSAV